MKVVLSKESWHCRLQEWTFGSKVRATDLCPYFWVTVFCLAMLPVTLLGSVITSFWEPVMQERHPGYGTRYYNDTRRFTNFEQGLDFTFISLMALLLLFLVIVSVPLFFNWVGLLIALAVLTVFGVPLGLAFSSDLWYPYLASFKDKVCPIIFWKEEEVTSSTQEQ